LRLEDVPMDGGKVAGGLVRVGVLYERLNTVGPLVDLRGRDHAIARGVLLRDADAPDDASPTETLARADERGHTRVGGQHDGVAPEHGERRLADERARLQDGVPVPFGLWLDDSPDHGQPLRTLQQLELLDARLRPETLLEPRARAEVALDRLLPRR